MPTVEETVKAMRGISGPRGTAAAPSVSNISLTEGFMESAVSGVLEPFGAEPSVSVEEFRRDNPTLGLVSEFAGLAVPYAGWFRLTKAPKYVKALSRIGDIERRPIITSAQRELARWLPFEAGRVGIAGLTGGDLEDTLGEAAIDLGLFGGLAGVGGAFRKAGQAVQKAGPGFGDINLRAPAQIQIRQIASKLEGLDEARVATAQRYIRELESHIRGESTSGPYLSELEIGGDPQKISYLFSPSVGKDTVRRQFTYDPRNGFDSLEAWQEASRRAFGDRKDTFALVQYPRRISFKTDNAARATLGNISKNLESLGNGWYWGKEAQEGLYVMARRYQGQGTAKADDLWTLFKTDSPGSFVPHRTQWAGSQVNVARLLGEVAKTDTGSAIYDQLSTFSKEIPLVSYVDDAVRHGKPKEFADRFARVTGINTLADSEILNRTKQFVRTYLAPSQHQFGHNPRARWIWGLARSAFDHANAAVDAMLYGPTQLRGYKNLFREIVSGGQPAGGIMKLVDDLAAEDIYTVWKTWNEGLSIKEAEALGASEKSLNFLSALEKMDLEQVAQIRATQIATGAKELNPLPWHYGLSRTWRGDWRVPIFNEGNTLVFMASGDRQGAIKEAQEIVKEAAGEGRTWKTLPNVVFESGHVQDLDTAAKVALRSSDYKLAAAIRDRQLRRAFTPRQFRERTGVEGYIGQKAPWSKDELRSMLTAGAIGRQKYMADISVRNQLASELGRLRIEDPSSYEALTARIEDLAGRASPASRWQNNITDTVMAPIVGTNSATKIVRSANRTMFDLTLGMGNVGFVAVNAMSFLQTTLPQISYVMHSPVSRLRRYYTWLPAYGADGLPKGGMGMLEPLKVLRQSFREMGKPDDALRSAFDRAAGEGVWDPRFVEEWVGENAREVGKLKDVFSSPGNFWKGIIAAGRAGPAVSEKFVRGHAFVTGHILARDFLKMEGEAAYRFAKEFTENTQFLYGTADRARIITSPLGSLFGLFKNWQMHYMAWMLEYSGEGIRGNWRPLLWMTGGTGAVAGAGGLPLYGVADVASRWMSDKSLMENIYGEFGQSDRDQATVSDAVFMGLPAFLGVSLQGSAAAPFADPSRDASMLFTMVHFDRAAALGRAVGTAFDRWTATGNHPIDGTQVRDQFIRALAPKTFYRSYAAWSDKYLKSLATGYPQMKDMTPVEKMMYSAGLMPRHLELTYKVNQELWNDQDRKRQIIQSYGKAWAEAVHQKDWRELRNIQQRAMVEGVDISSVIKSASSRLSKGSEEMIERNFDPAEVLRYQRSILGR